VSPEDSATLATQYTLALLQAGKIPAQNADATKEVVAAITLSHQQFTGYFLKVPGALPAKTRPPSRPAPLATDPPADPGPDAGDPADGPGAA
jgi:hypothetical protein